MESKYTHATIHHDPEGRCLDLLRDHARDLKELFVDGFIVVTRETVDQNTSIGAKTYQLLNDSGFRITTRSTVKTRQLDTSSDIALIAAKERGGGDLIFTGCLDRTLHWMEFYPEELREVLARGTDGADFLILGRTKRALETHPRVQLEPEIYTNEATARILDLPGVDFASGLSRIMTHDSAVKIVEFLKRNLRVFNREIDINDSYWVMAAKFEGLAIGYRQVEGLEFETPDQFKKEIADLGYEEWLRQNFSEANLSRRMERAYETERVLLRHLETFGNGAERER